MHMAIGTPLCCGQIEIYPRGEYSAIYGHGNMARKMGVKYERIDLPGSSTIGSGSVLPSKDIADLVRSMLAVLRQKPSCIHPSALDDPYFDNKRVDVWK